MITFPNAKINLGLHITEKRVDGFHNIETVFYPLRLSDTLEFVVGEKASFQNTGISVDANPQDNLIWKAYQLLANDFKILPLQVHLHKQIPFGAGLGGGSADAAFMIKMLNENFRLGLSQQQQQNYARQLGSDCAFFINNKAVLASEKGDVFESVELSLKGYHLVLVKPPVHVSTPQAYAKVIPKKPSVSLKEIIQSPVEDWKRMLVNDFEISVFDTHPSVEEIKKTLYIAGAEYASMSGSGSSVFGLFRNEPPIIDFPSNYFLWKEKML